MDFDPQQGDTVRLQLGQSAKNDKLRSELNNLNSEDVRIDSDGDLEIKLENDNWVRVVNLKKTNLKVGVTQHSDHLLLHFSKDF